MQSHGPKRVYTPHSLEFWFGKLEHEWEGAFSERQLEHGHQIYRDGEVRELELTAHEAIVHRRVEKKDEYVVIEWDADGLSVRSSSTDLDVARALAVAGLHEIEELVADEISPLPVDSAPATNGTHAHGPASHHHAASVTPPSRNGHATPPPPPPWAPPPPPPPPP
ncbi:MAG: hypothetical protein RLZZ15_4318, partial [Verrucomicrobiota bacterium]